MVYIGQTTQPLARRWRQHQRQAECVRLHRAVLKHGPEAFSIERLVTGESKLQLDMLERFWIGVHQATDRAYGYNLKDGGSAGKCSDETRKRMSENWWKRDMDPGYRKKLSDAKKGRQVSAETRDRLAKSNTGKRHSDDTVAVMSDVRRNLWQDPNYRAAVTAAQNAGKRTPEARAAAAAKTRAQMADPEKRKRMLEAMAAGKARAKAARERGEGQP